jgi:hypothetical protein
VKNRFQSLPFKCNLQRYTTAAATAATPALAAVAAVMDHDDEVGRCRLNQVDP